MVGAWLVVMLAPTPLIPAIAATDALNITSPQTLGAPAEAVHAQAQFDLGISLLCGPKSAANAAEAARWMALAAAQGHAGAQSVLGWMHMTATGVPRNDVLAARWLHRAAEQDDTAAQNNLGVLFALGQGVTLDRTQAARWFSAAAEKGADDAARNLERLHRGGSGTARPARAAAAPSLHPALLAAHCPPQSKKKVQRP